MSVVPDWRRQLIERETRLLNAVVRRWGRDAAARAGVEVAASIVAAVADAGVAPARAPRRRSR